MSYNSTTPNLHLPQWILSDPPQMSDFNSAFNSIDTFAGTPTPISLGGGGGTTAQESAKNIMDDASTEWHDLPLASGATPGPYRKPQYRIIGNHVFVSGDVAIKIDGTNLALIAQLPEGYGPPGNVYKGAMATGFQLGRLLIGSARNLYVEWVYSLQTGNRFDGQLSWICIDMDWYVDTQASPANIIAAENEVSNDTA